MSNVYGVNNMQARINSIGVTKLMGVDGVLRAARNIKDAPADTYKPNRSQRRHQAKITKKETK
jgi:hypothetical protein